MASKIEALWKQVIKTFVIKKCGTLHYDQENLSVLKRQVDAMTREDVALDASLSERELRLRHRTAGGSGSGSGTDSPRSCKAHRSAPVTHIEVCSNPTATLEVFVLHEKQRMPLHDHPHMLGILKVIAGTVSIDSYTVISHECQTPGSAVLLARKQTDIVRSSDPACVLTPSDRNFHAISSINGLAAFLDILSPPYYCDVPGSSPNPCNFYEEGGFIDSSVAGEKLVRLVEVPMPKEYWCDTAPYKGPLIDVDCS